MCIRDSLLVDADGPAGPASAELEHRYFHGISTDQTLAVETADGSVQWLLGDHQGSVRDVVDENGQALDQIVYDAFGNFLSRDNPELALPYGFTGREFDEATGLYFYRARYYDPSLMRFISPDPSGLAAGDTNLYRYVRNLPTTLVDPTGLIAASLNPQAVEDFRARTGLGPSTNFSIAQASQVRGTNLVDDFRALPGQINAGIDQLRIEVERFPFRMFFEDVLFISGRDSRDKRTALERNFSNLNNFTVGLRRGVIGAAVEVTDTFRDARDFSTGAPFRSALFQTFSQVRGVGDLAKVGLGIIAAPVFGFVGFTKTLLSGDPLATGSSLVTTLPAPTKLFGFSAGRAALAFFGQPVLRPGNNGLAGLLDTAAIPRRAVGRIYSEYQRLRDLRGSVARTTAQRLGNQAELRSVFARNGQLGSFLEAQSFNLREGQRIRGEFPGSARDILGDLGGVDGSILKGLESNNRVARQVQYVLENMQDQPLFYRRMVEVLREGTSLDEIATRGLVSGAVFDQLGAASKGLGRTETLGVFGSLGADLGAFVNRHILSQALLSGRVSVSALQKAYPDELGEALLTGRLLPDFTKQGGAFGRSTDFDLGVLDNPLGGSKVFKEVTGSADTALATQIRNSITDPNLQGLDIDFKYSKFENNSNGGLVFSDRGRSFFFQGQFLGRQQSRLYGQSGRVVRDLPELFTKNPPPRGISTTELLANSPVAATWATDITFGLIGAQDTIATARDNRDFFSSVGNGVDAVVGGPSALNSYIGGIASRFQVSAEPASESVSPSVAAATSFVFNVARPDSPHNPLEAVLQEAIASWGTLVADSSVKNITIRMEDLPGNQL